MVHEDDLSGYLMDRTNQWHHLKIPAIAEEDEQWILSNNRQFNRTKGAVINPKHTSFTTMNSYKSEMGSVVFASQYQQNPAPIDGAIIKRKWFNRYDTNNLPQFQRIIQSWDTASKTKEVNAYSACCVLGIDNKNKYYLLEVYRNRLEMPDLLRKVIAIYDQYHKQYQCPICLVIEDASSGTQLIQILKERNIYAKSIQATNDKLSRFKGISVKVEQGDVYVPKVTQRWWHDFENEIVRFPNSKYKDQADSFSQALAYQRKRIARIW